MNLKNIISVVLFLFLGFGCVAQNQNLSQESGLNNNSIISDSIFGQWSYEMQNNDGSLLRVQLTLDGDQSTEESKNLVGSLILIVDDNGYSNYIDAVQLGGIPLETQGEIAYQINWYKAESNQFGSSILRYTSDDTLLWYDQIGSLANSLQMPSEITLSRVIYE